MLNEGDLTTMLGSGNVTVNTGSGTLAQQVEDIVIAANFSWTNANSLTLDAYRSVTFTAPVTANGSAPVSLITNDGGTGGNLSFVSGGSLSFANASNSLSIDGEAYTLESSVSSLSKAIAHKASGRYALSANYDASGDGTYKKSPIKTKFRGSFNGLGNTISNLSMSGNSNLGLFAYVLQSGSISSLTLADAKMVATSKGLETNAGSAVGMNYGTVFNVSASGNLSVAVAKGSGSVLGGLVGSNSGTIMDSSASATVKATGKSGANGLVYLGSLVGTSSGTLEHSYATGASAIEGANLWAMTGGLVGFNTGPLENCYATGSTSGGTNPNSTSGGLVGNDYSTVASSYSTGTVHGGSGSYVGALIGNDDHGANGGTITNDYWDTSTSGITNLADGAGNVANDPGITGETTAQLQAGLPSGFDPTIWVENPSINSGLPYLIANPPQ